MGLFTTPNVRKVRRTLGPNFELLQTSLFCQKPNFEPPEHHKKPNSSRTPDSSFHLYNLSARDLPTTDTYILHIKSNFCAALQVAETLDIPDAAAAISCISKGNVGNGAL